MIETFVRLIDGRLNSSSSSVWQGVLNFQSNITINQLVSSAVQAGGRASSHIDVQANNWRFLLYNHKFGEYCDTNSRDKRAVCDGDKFQLIYVPKNIEIGQSNQQWNRSASGVTELIFLDDDEEDVKPSIDALIRAKTSSILTAANQVIPTNECNNGREIRRGSTRHLSMDLIRQLGNDYDEEELDNEDEQNSRSSSPRPKTARTNQENGRKRSKINNEDDSDSDPMFKTKEQPKYRRNSSIMSEKSNCQTDKLEDGPCTMHSQSAEECSHSKFKNVDAIEILNSASSGQAILSHLQSFADAKGPVEIEHGIRCKLMNAIGTFLMHNADNRGLPTAVERRILVHTFLSQLPCQLEPTVFTNRGGTGCLDYWVRNRRKTIVRDDGVYMVRGSKKKKLN